MNNTKNMYNNINIELIRSHRKTMCIEITRDLRVIVRAPINMPTYRIKAFVRDKADWIDEKLMEMTVRQRNQEKKPLLSDAEIKELHDKAVVILSKKTEYYARIIGVDYGRITIRHQKTRWGSCSAKGNINYNCMLMLAPDEIQDYVVVHELCHRLEMNHSPRFWAEVEKVLPDYKQRRKWLKDNGNSLNYNV
jgi:predicted metal-dependent hydrolase